MESELNEKEHVEYLLNELLKLTPEMKKYFKLWNDMSSYDLYLIQNQLDPLNKIKLEDKEILKNHKGYNPVDIVNKRARFDILYELSNFPHILDAILSHFNLKELLILKMVSKSWKNFILDEVMAYKRLKFIYSNLVLLNKDQIDSNNNIIQYYPTFSYNDSLLHYFKSQKTFYNNPTIESRILLTTDTINTNKDNVLFIKFIFPYIVVVTKKYNGCGVIIWKSNLEYPAAYNSGYLPFNCPLLSFIFCKEITVGLSPSSIDLSLFKKGSNPYLSIYLGLYLRGHMPLILHVNLSSWEYKLIPNKSSYKTTFSVISLIYVDFFEFLVLGNSEGSISIYHTIEMNLLNNVIIDNKRNPIISIEIIDHDHVLAVSSSGIVKLLKVEVTNSYVIHSSNNESSFNYITPQLSMETVFDFSITPSTMYPNEGINLHKSIYKSFNLILTSASHIYYIIIIPCDTKTYALRLIHDQPLPFTPASLDFTIQPLSFYLLKQNVIISIDIANLRESERKVPIFGIMLSNSISSSPCLIVLNLKKNSNNDFILENKEVKGVLTKHTRVGIMKCLGPDLLAVSDKHGLLWLMRITEIN
ncbi:hypothetical protein K502DRAFT_350865 [Neoconidiobolus thromboides FSU 785]|nr:hypothetical protein K502DRAFT_350865 [Neoconidiobolus thromboides FSU 785]